MLRIEMILLDLAFVFTYFEKTPNLSFSDRLQEVKVTEGSRVLVTESSKYFSGLELISYHKLLEGY